MSFPFVQPYFGLGNSLQTAQAAAGGAGGIGGWVEVGRTTLGSAGDDITVSSLPDKRYYMVLSDLQDNGSSISSQIRLGNSSIDTGSNYAKRTSKAGGTDATATSQSTIDVNTGFAANEDSFNITYIANKSDKEKLIQNWWTSNATGAGNAPYRIECVAKWANTSNSLDIFNNHNAEAGSYNTGSEVVVLGWDPDDTHTTNFWEELASVSNTTTQDNNSTGTFTAKKYLWVQMWLKVTGATNTNLSLNNVTSGTPYAVRESEDGASDYTLTSQNSMTIGSIKNNHSRFINMFIVNNGSNEPLCVGHYVDANTTGAGNAPKRAEFVFKSSNTTQITEIDTDNSGGGSYTAFECKVWGSD